ncbi:hypothetical protein [Succinivibrio dextrinosolvens]|uniref:VirB4 family type IV secretion/conjugal transfer ATPase n=1 Tax=Succinivibrio dextrinosolvens TaxID=83771 RepID=UPI0004E1ADC9|nr:hypothetical protein [Succinivibrio dextrinosolvens]
MLLSSTFMLCGIILLLLCAFVTVGLFLPYKRFSRQYSFTDLLDYAVLGPKDTVILKNGALMKVYRIIPVCTSYLNEHDAHKIHSMLCSSIKKLDKTYMVNCDVIRSADLDKEDSVFFGSNAARRLYEKRSEYFERNRTFKNEFFISFTRLNSSAGADDIISLLKGEKSFREGLISEIDSFNHEAKSFIDGFSSVCEIKELGISQSKTQRVSSETVNFLYSCIKGVNTSLSYPSCRPLLDTLLSSEDFIPGKCPMLGNRYIGIISIDGFPLTSDFGVLKALCTLPFEYRFSNRFISYSSIESSLKMALLRRLWIQRRKSFFSMFSSSADSEVNKDAEEMVENVDEARKSMVQNEHNFGALSSTLIIFDESIESLERKAQMSLKVFEKLGFSGRVETVNATDAYLGSLPGHSIENLRRAMVSGEVVADLMPLHKNYLGERQSPNKGYGESAPHLMTVVSSDSEKAYLNLHVKDLANCLVVGPPGSGKSVFLGTTLLSLLKYEGMKIFAFDKGQSFYALNRFLNGRHICLDESSSERFCPLYDLGDKSKITEGALFIEKLYEYAGKTLTDSERGLIFSTVELLSENPSYRHSLTDFYNLLNNSELKGAFRQYIRSVNPLSPLDGNENPNLNSHLTVFECGNFFESGNRNLYPVLNCIFSQINSEIPKVKSSAIIIDEAWLMLSNSYFCSQLLSWIKTVRKHNTMVILATQSVNDFARAKLLEDILDCVKTRIYLPNADIKSPSLKELYSKLGLNDLQQQEIFEGTPKQDLFLHKDGNFMKFNLAISESELKLLSFTAKDRSELDLRFNSEGGEFVWEL